MTINYTHFKYVCRACLREHLQPISVEDPKKTPIPRCCGRDRDMAYKGAIRDEASNDQESNQ
jgi:hypothetical protein